MFARAGEEQRTDGPPVAPMQLKRIDRRVPLEDILCQRADVGACRAETERNRCLRGLAGRNLVYQSLKGVSGFRGRVGGMGNADRCG